MLRMTTTSAGLHTRTRQGTSWWRGRPRLGAVLAVACLVVAGGAASSEAPADALSAIPSTVPMQSDATLDVASGPSCPHDGFSWTCQFSYTGATQLWQVPADVNLVTLDVRGASGQDSPTNIDIDRSWPGGWGGESVAKGGRHPRRVPRARGRGPQRLQWRGLGICVGRRRLRRSADAVRAVEPSGRRGRGGGGGFDVFCFPGCSAHPGGAGGGLTGGAAGGGPGTQTSGGAAEVSSQPNFPSSPGTFGAGGAGFSGGGGGGYYGGGGGTITGDFSGGGGGGGRGSCHPVRGTRRRPASTPATARSPSATRRRQPPTRRVYTTAEARWLLTDMAALHTPDLATTQHHAASVHGLPRCTHPGHRWHPTEPRLLPGIRTDRRHEHLHQGRERGAPPNRGPLPERPTDAATHRRRGPRAPSGEGRPLVARYTGRSALHPVPATAP